jgi:hypothetical protein
MPAGDLISATDYNNIRNKIIAILGAGSGNQGYGQTVQSSTVAIGNTVTKAQWDLLRFDIFNTLLHQTGTSPTVSSATVGNVITFGATQPVNQYDTLSDTATTNRFNIGTGRFLENIGIATKSQEISWSMGAQSTATITFSNSNQARYFFNSGGKIKVRVSRSGGATTDQNTSWSSLLTSAGAITLGSQLPSTGFTPLDGTNFYKLTNTFQRIFTITASSPYAANRYSIDARCNVTNNSAGTATTVFIRAVLDDPYIDPARGVNSGTIHQIWTSVAATSRFTVVSTTGMVSGYGVRFAGTAIGGVAVNTTYFIHTVVSATEFTISNTFGGEVRTLTDGSPLAINVTATTASNRRLTTASTASLAVGRALRFTGTVFGGVNTTTVYYVSQIVSATQFTISTSPTGGAAVAVSNGSGTMPAQMSQFTANVGTLQAAVLPEDQVDGTHVLAVDEVKATGALQPAPTAGNFTIISPTITVSDWVIS